jgi:hypothetical protein
MLDASKLEEVFNLSPQIIEGEFSSDSKDVMVVPKQVPIAFGKLEDSDYIRKNLKELADSTKDALDLALTIQQDDPNARNTEAVAKMADAVAKALGNLIQLNKTEKDEEFRAKPEEPKIVNNNLTIMTTEEIIAKIINQTKQLKEK